MSHEIRTPLHAIIGVTSLLLDDELKPGIREQIHTIHTSSDHLLGVVNDILDFSKTPVGWSSRGAGRSGGRDPGSARPRRPHRRVQAARDRLRGPPGVPATLMADGGRLRQVLANLLSNVVKFTAEGGVVLRVRLQSSGAPVVEFTVEDTGVGIPRERLDRLFQPFS